MGSKAAQREETAAARAGLGLAGLHGRHPLSAAVLSPQVCCQDQPCSGWHAADGTDTGRRLLVLLVVLVQGRVLLEDRIECTPDGAPAPLAGQPCPGLHQVTESLFESHAPYLVNSG